MRAAQMRQEVAENLEPSTSINNSIIEKQDALLGMIYREETASPEMKKLKRDIESKKPCCKSGGSAFQSFKNGCMIIFRWKM